MRKTISRHSKFRLFAISIVTLPAFGILLWRGIPAMVVPPTVAPTIASIPMPINVPLAALKAAPDRTTSTPAAPAPVAVPSAPTNAPIIAPTSVAGTENIGAPIRILIPSIGVDALIEPVALTATAAMDTPKDPLDAGWYDLGPRPGETGSAVVDGHVDWYNGGGAVFANLDKLKAGDKIMVSDANGSTVTFSVRDSLRYDPSADATAVFISNDGSSHLNLITCDGVWDKQAKQYSKRLVVFADRI